MTTEQMKYFLTVAECQSFTKAAEQLFITQPALSRHITKMEEELNLQLFIRTGSGIRLTPAGSSLMKGLQDIYNNYVSQVERAKKIQMGLNGFLKIGILAQTNVADFMPKIYQDIKHAHPNVDLSFEQASFRSLLNGLYNGKYDLIFSLKFEIEKKESILYQYVSRSKDYIVMPASHPLAAQETVTLEDVKNETFVMISTDDNPESSGLIYALCREHFFYPNAIFAHTLEEQILWVESGLGITILDSRCEIKNNPYMKCFELESNWDCSLVVCWNQGNRNPLIPLFLDKLRDVLDLKDNTVYGGGKK